MAELSDDLKAAARRIAEAAPPVSPEARAQLRAIFATTNQEVPTQ